MFTLAGGPVSWSSQRQKTVATSTMDAEYIASAEAAKEAVWIRNLVNDLRIPGIHIDTVPLYIDSNSALKLTRNPELHNKSKHIDVKCARKRRKDLSQPACQYQGQLGRCCHQSFAQVYTRGFGKPSEPSIGGRHCPRLFIFIQGKK